MVDNHEQKMTNKMYFDMMEKYKKPRKLTIEELRSYKGCENLDDEEAEEIIDGLLKLSIIMCRKYNKE